MKLYGGIDLHSNNVHVRALFGKKALMDSVSS